MPFVQIGIQSEWIESNQCIYWCSKKVDFTRQLKTRSLWPLLFAWNAKFFFPIPTPKGNITLCPRKLLTITWLMSHMAIELDLKLKVTEDIAEILWSKVQINAEQANHQGQWTSCLIYFISSSYICCLNTRKCKHCPLCCWIIYQEKRGVAVHEREWI